MAESHLFDSHWAGFHGKCPCHKFLYPCEIYRKHMMLREISGVSMRERKRVGRPSQGPRKGIRNLLGLRVTAETKTRLEAATAASRRSQSLEAEFRLEQSFRKEDDGIAALGGSEQHALFRMMAAAAEIIENRTGKSWTFDWETSIVVRDAWNALTTAILPKPPKEYSELFRSPHLCRLNDRTRLRMSRSAD